MGPGMKPTDQITLYSISAVPLRKVRRRAKAIHLRKDKVVRLSDLKYVKTDDMYDFETKF